MKRLIVCCDGTWNVPDRKDGPKVCPSNVTKIALAVPPLAEDGVVQRTFYGRGVGTGVNDRLPGGMFGLGLSAHILDAYRFLVREFEPGDELYLFGFSRGAYTVRSLAGLIRNCGILMPEYLDKVNAAYALYRRRDDASAPDAIESRLFRKTYAVETRIKFIGVWDTVGALGVPVLFPWLAFLNRRWQFHDVKLSSYVDYAYQALAIDERRKLFVPTLWEQQEHKGAQIMEQRWFAGVHSNVGGGYVDTGLADLAFAWIAEKARRCGLTLDDRFIADTIHPDPLGVLRDSRTGVYRLLPARDRPIGVHNSANEDVAPSAIERMSATDYRPKNLCRYLNNRARHREPA